METAHVSYPLRVAFSSMASQWNHTGGSLVSPAYCVCMARVGVTRAAALASSPQRRCRWVLVPTGSRVCVCGPQLKNITSVKLEKRPHIPHR